MTKFQELKIDHKDWEENMWNISAQFFFRTNGHKIVRHFY